MAKKKRSSPETSGVRELVWVPAKDLADNPANWRRHPPRQMKALAASIKENGWAGALLYNEITGRLIDGHARKQCALQAAKSSGSGLVPVLVGRWTEEQERRILATLDPISAMAEMDEQALRNLTERMDRDLEQATEKMEEETRETFHTITRELNSEAEAVAYGGPSSFFPEEQEDSSPQPEAQPSAGIDDKKGELVGAMRLKSREEVDWDAWGAGVGAGHPAPSHRSVGRHPGADHHLAWAQGFRAVRPLPLSVRVDGLGPRWGELRRRLLRARRPLRAGMGTPGDLHGQPVEPGRDDDHLAQLLLL